MTPPRTPADPPAVDPKENPDAEPDPTQPWVEAEGWRPEAGDVLAGKVVSVDMGWSDYIEGNYPIVVIETDDGAQHAVHGFQQMLFDAFMSLQPTVGEPIIVRCGAKRQTRDGKRTVVPYKVEMPERENVGQNVWAQLGEQRSPSRRGGKPAAAAPTAAGDDDEPIPF